MNTLATTSVLALMTLAILATSAHAAPPRVHKVRYDVPGTAHATYVGQGTPKLWEGRYADGIAYTVWYVESGNADFPRARAIWAGATSFSGAVGVSSVQRMGEGSKRIAAVIWRRSTDNWNVLSAVKPLADGYAMIELSSSRDNMTGTQVENVLAVAMDMQTVR